MNCLLLSELHTFNFKNNNPSTHPEVGVSRLEMADEGMAVEVSEVARLLKVL